MDQQVFQTLKDIIYRESGIVLGPEKMPLLANRLRKILLKNGLDNEHQYLELLETDLSGYELIQLIEAISTNTTHFFREEKHFSTLAKTLQGYEAEGKKNFKLWCAAASSGEEPYTLLITVLENISLKKTNFKFLATDINTRVLTRAANGLYTRSAVSKIPTPLVEKYFQPIEHADDIFFQVKEEYRQMVLYKKLNLIEFPYPLRGNIDIIFCRNVMIYFDLTTRAKIVNQMEKLLARGGYLYLSHSESLLGIDHKLEKVDSSVFRKPL